jgi:mannosyltransferase
MQASRTTRTTPPLAVLAALASVVLGVALRLYTRSELWLDEALTANTARLPLGAMFEQLRHDGHPPLYYLLLHVWMKVFGESNVGVRSLSGVFGIAALGLFWVAARRYGGRACAVAGVVLLASSPFAIRFSTETRMYSLVMLLVIAGWLAVREALERPTLLRLAGVAVLSGLLALTHYWAFYLLASVVLLLLWRWRRGDRSAFKVVLAIAAGAVLFLPWLPSFLEQAAHTGTPWGLPERPTNVFALSFNDWGGGPTGEAYLLGVGLLLLVAFALVARGLDDRRIELDLRTHPHARPEAFVVFTTMAIAVVAGYVTSGAFATRYTAMVFPLVMLLAAYGATALTSPKVQAGVLVVLAVLGFVSGIRNVGGERTQAGHVASYIVAQGRPGDVVAVCPDQLGPALTRLLPAGFDAVRFPDFGDPRLVNWVDYAKRQRSVTPDEFARRLNERAAGKTLWFVWSSGYRTVQSKCQAIASQLVVLRPGGHAVLASGAQFEHSWLYQYAPG